MYYVEKFRSVFMNCFGISQNAGMSALVNILVPGLYPDMKKMFAMTCVGWEGRQDLTKLVRALQHCERQLQCKKPKSRSEVTDNVLYARQLV